MYRGDVREVWGTCAVNDHRRREAFLREILLFDRLVVPVPSTKEERERWRRPNPNDPDETWDPDLLDEFLGVLGTQDTSGHNGARLVWTSPWTEQRWQRARLKIADDITDDGAFHATRSWRRMRSYRALLRRSPRIHPSSSAARSSGPLRRHRRTSRPPKRSSCWRIRSSFRPSRMARRCMHFNRR
jgi:hypothetical protein